MTWMVGIGHNGQMEEKSEGYVVQLEDEDKEDGKDEKKKNREEVFRKNNKSENYN